MKSVKTTTSKITKTLSQKEFKNLIGVSQDSRVTIYMRATDGRMVTYPEHIVVNDSLNYEVEMVITNDQDEVIVHESN